MKKERAARLSQVSKDGYNKYKERFIGKEVSVIFEKEIDGMLFGHSSEYLEVYCQADQSLLHTMVNVCIQRYEDDRLIANLKEEN